MTLDNHLSLSAGVIRQDETFFENASGDNAVPVIKEMKR